jgi:hypothetical protein
MPAATPTISSSSTSTVTINSFHGTHVQIRRCTTDVLQTTSRLLPVLPVPISRAEKAVCLVDRCVCTWLWKWYLACRFASHSRSSVRLLYPALSPRTDATPVFLGVTSQSSVCANMYLIGVCSTMRQQSYRCAPSPPNDFSTFHIWSTPSPCVAREIRCCAGKRARIQTHPSGVPVAETLIHSLSVISSLNFRMIRLTPSSATDLNL